MANYSKITAMRIKNFRCLGDVALNFRESPIISLVANNEGGKTSVVKAIESIMYNSNQREGKNFIRTGTNGYSILQEFEDGNVVERSRTDGANIYRLFKGGKIISENLKLDNGEIPPEIKCLMGVIEDEDTGELMNIRTYEDMLLFVLSKASDNYKTMYNALKVENITKAMKNGKSESALLKNDITGTEISIASFNEQIKAIRIVDTTPVKNIRERVSQTMKTVEFAHSILDKKIKTDAIEEQLGLYGEVSKTSEVNIVVASLLNAISNERERYKRLANEIEKSKDVTALKDVSYTEIVKMENIISRITALRSMEEASKGSMEVDKAQTVEVQSLELFNRVLTLIDRVKMLESAPSIEVSSVGSISTESVEKLSTLVGLLQGLKNSELEAKKNEEELEKAVNELKKLGHYDEELGGFVKACDNCGETVVITLNEMEAML